MQSPLPLIALVLLAAAGSAVAQDAARGAMTYLRTPLGRASCVSCHGADPGANPNNILRGADNPQAITKALNTVSPMGFLRSQLSDADRADVAAFLGTVARQGLPATPARLWPVALEFGVAATGTVTPEHQLRLLNASAIPLRFGGAALQGAGGRLTHDCPAQLQAGSACTLRLALDAPADAHAARSALEVELGAQRLVAGASLLPASANASALRWDADSDVVSFGPGPGATARRTVALFNPGPMPATLGTTTVVGPQAHQFQVAGCARGSTLQAGTRCDLSIEYTPSLLPSAEAMLSVRSDQTNPTSLRLAGGGVPPAPVEPPPALPVDGGGGCSTGGGTSRPDPLLAGLLLVALAALWRRPRGPRPPRPTA